MREVFKLLSSVVVGGTPAKVGGLHPFPYRTRKLNRPTSTVVLGSARAREAVEAGGPHLSLASWKEIYSGG